MNYTDQKVFECECTYLRFLFGWCFSVPVCIFFIVLACVCMHIGESNNLSVIESHFENGSNLCSKHLQHTFTHTG